jgi:hypothetical protein
MVRIIDATQRMAWNQDSAAMTARLVFGQASIREITSDGRNGETAQSDELVRRQKGGTFTRFLLVSDLGTVPFGKRAVSVASHLPFHSRQQQRGASKPRERKVVNAGNYPIVANSASSALWEQTGK